VSSDGFKTIPAWLGALSRVIASSCRRGISSPSFAQVKFNRGFGRFSRRAAAPSAPDRG
jgi:hypothetical protein